MEKQYDIRRLQLIQLQILKDVQTVCERKNIKFFIMNGTCLGAVRHQGSIPWDDDIDIGMYWEDFDRFVKCQDEFDSKYFIQTVETDPEFRTMIARVRLTDSTIIEKEFMDCDINHGIFIDVYPLFDYPDNPIIGQWRSWESLLYRLLLAGRAPLNHGKGAALLGNTIHKLLPKEVKDYLIQKISRKLRSGSKDSKNVAFLYGMDVSFFHTIIYPREWFEKTSNLKYEDTYFPAPSEWDKYLRLRYNDYLKLPPVDKQNSYHSFEFVDLNKCYKNYKGVKYLQERTQK